jgi:hypothetical protein
MKTILLYFFTSIAFSQSYNASLIEERKNETWQTVNSKASILISNDKIIINNQTFVVIKITKMIDDSFIYDCSSTLQKCHFLLVNGLLFQYLDKQHFLYHLKQ